MDKDDNIVDEAEKLLLSSSSFSVDEIFRMMDGIGAAVPAHIDRTSYSIISNLGFIPNISNLKTVEVSSTFIHNSFVDECIKKYKVITSSDAHHLGHINERINCLDLDDLDMIVDWMCK